MGTQPKDGWGGHGVRISGFLPYAESRGRRFRILCSKNKMRTEVCPWTCLYEESTSGWVLVGGNFEHKGHILATSAAEAMAMSGTAFLPDQLMELGTDAVQHGRLGVAQLDSLLRSKARELGLPITWEPQHLRSRFPFLSSTQLDLSGFTAFLKSREIRVNTSFELQCSDEGAATHIFVELEGGFEDWANCEENVLLFDPTCLERC